MRGQLLQTQILQFLSHRDTEVRDGKMEFKDRGLDKCRDILRAIILGTVYISDSLALLPSLELTSVSLSFRHCLPCHCSTRHVTVLPYVLILPYQYLLNQQFPLLFLISCHSKLHLLLMFININNSD